MTQKTSNSEVGKSELSELHTVIAKRCHAIVALMLIGTTEKHMFESNKVPQCIAMPPIKCCCQIDIKLSITVFPQKSQNHLIKTAAIMK